MSLDDRWVDLIFTKLALVYGARFWQQYPGLDSQLVRSNWAKELEGMSAAGIKYALANLPTDWPPNVLQFRQLCRRAQREDLGQPKLAPPDKAVPCPPGVRERFKAAIQQMREGHADRLGWARKLQQREQAGERLSAAQRAWWRSVLLHRAAVQAEQAETHE